MTPRPGDGWVDCRCGHRHWGLHGAAGLLLARRGPHPAVVLQHRAEWTHQGGTWGVPGGAREPQESAAEGALREAAEEAGIDPSLVRIVGEHVLDHGDWSYTTVLAVLTVPDAEVRPTDAESAEIRWVPLEEVDRRPLHSGFAEAWPLLRPRIEAEIEAES
jgi:8-oxo-dGTP diphosphatase